MMGLSEERNSGELHPLPSFALLLRPFAPRALPRFLATTASADFFPALAGKISPGKVQNLFPRAVRLYPMRLV